MSTKAIEQFLATAYSDERLAMLLAHAEDGKLAYASCSCLIGIPAATHALRGYGSYCGEMHAHFPASDLAASAEREFLYFAKLREPDEDAKRRAKLIPLIHAEMERRAALRETPEEVCAV